MATNLDLRDIIRDGVQSQRAAAELKVCNSAHGGYTTWKKRKVVRISRRWKLTHTRERSGFTNNCMRTIRQQRTIASIRPLQSTQSKTHTYNGLVERESIRNPFVTQDEVLGLFRGWLLAKKRQRQQFGQAF